MIDVRSPRWLITLVAVVTALAATLSFAQAPTPAQASGGALSSLTLTNANITLNAQPTPFLFYGTASAKDDTTNVVATFTAGTATYAVNGVNQGSLTSGVGSPAALNTGITEITVTHTDTAVTTYTIKITRSFPITGFTVIDADDSTVLYDYPAPFNVNTVIPPITVGHDVDRIRYRMTYADPTGAPGVTGYQTWIDNAGFCPGTCASGEWSPPFTLAVGSNTWGPVTQVTTTIDTPRTSWFTVITRQPAFTSSTLTNLQLTNPNITLNAQPTPYLFYGTASAKDDTTNVVATFTTGTATYAVNGVNQGSLVSGAGSPAALNTGITEITVTHVGSVTTTYTIKITRSFPITSLTVIDADDSTVLYDYPAPFNVTTVIPPITVGHDVDRVRYRMTYANPSAAPGVTNYQTWIDNAGGCPSGPCASGEWSPPFTLAVGPNTRGPITQVTTDIGNNHTSWTAVITRQPAFTSSTLSNLQLTNANITLNAQPTPFLFHGNASAKDDTTNVVATFTTGTATYAVNGVNQGSLVSGAGSPAALNTGITEITVTHVGSVTTTYTIKIVRSFPITSLTVIDADDSTVLYDYPAPFNVTTVIPPITVGHDVDRVRYRMTYANPSAAPGVTNYQTWIDNAGGCPSGPCASGEWSPPFTLAVGPNTRGPITQVTTDIGNNHTSWTAVITRATAFAAIGSITVPPSGNAIPAGTQVTVTPGSVTGNPAPVVTYTWEAAPTANDPFEPVATTVSPVWTPDNTVADQLLRVVATADNGFSTPTSITSTTFGPISGVNEAPSVTTVTISGSAVEGQTLTASARVLGYPRPTVTYRWLRATDDTATFSTIPGASASTYTLTANDVNRVVRVEVTAGANTQGPADSDESASTSRVAAGSSPSPSPSPTPSPTPSPSPSPGGGGGANPALPGSPESVTATAVGRTLLVAWQPPASPGASAVSHYDVLLQPSMKRCVTTALTCVMDVKPGRTYRISVRALNGGGWGAWSDATVAVPPAPRFAFTAVIEKGKLILTGTSAHVPAGTRLNVRITRGSVSGPRVESGPLVTATGRYTWSRKIRTDEPITVKIGYNSIWSLAKVAQR